MTWYEACLLGVIQGLTEFLPISSTAHLVATRQLLGHEDPEDAFTTVVQLGTLVAVLIYFRGEIADLTRAVIGDLRSRRFASSPQSRLAWLIVLGTIPAVIAGGLLKHWLKETFYNIPSMAVVSIVFGLLMGAAELWARRRQMQGAPVRGVEQVGWVDALWVGCWQALA